MLQQQILVVLGYVEHQGKVLLSQRNEPSNPDVHLVWEFPGGTNHFGETLEQTCVRELKEELGVDVEPLELLPHPVSHTWNRGEQSIQVHLICFRCRYIGGEPQRLEEEINDVRWVPKEELSQYRFFETGRKFVEQARMLNCKCGMNRRHCEPQRSNPEIDADGSGSLRPKASERQTFPRDDENCMRRINRIAVLAVLWTILVPAVVWAQSVSRIDFTNPNLKLTDLVDDQGMGIAKFIQALVQFLVPLAGVVAIVIIIIAGIMRIVAGGNADRAKTSGEMMWGAIIGLGIALGSVLILNTINSDLTLLSSIKFEPVKKITDVKKPEVGLTKARGRVGGPGRSGGGAGSGGGEPSGDGPTGPALDNLRLTNYWPVSGNGEQTMEGGLETSRPGPDGRTNRVCTLEMYRTGQCSYVTLASDPSRYGQWHTISERTYTNARGETYTLRNIPAYVHDTGSAFTGRPDKFDIATDISTSDGEAARFDGRQPRNPNTLLLPRTGP